LRRREVEAQELLEHTRERFAARAAELGRELRVAPGPARELEADPERVEQALGNLVENALRHGTGSIELASRAGTDAVELHVRDDGPGIPATFLARAFDRFSQADESRGGSGSGLGLAIVHSIALAHGGSARAANPPEGGLDIWISLPARPTGAAPRDKPPDQQEPGRVPRASRA
jgi:signal transduction histidine kinase